MPYKRPGSPYYQCRRKNLPGFGDTGLLSSQVKSKAVARQMERCLEEIAERALITPAYCALLEAVVNRDLDLPTLLIYRNRRDLDALLRSLSDPLLLPTVEAYVAATSPGRTKTLGFDMLLHYAPAKARLSYLSGKNITELCLAAESDGRKRNSVRRTLLRAISVLLRHELGNAERNRIFTDVDFAGEDDTREVYLTAGDIGRLLQACADLNYVELGTIIRMALQTSADRGVLLAGQHSHGAAPGLRVRHLQIYEEADGSYSGEVFLPDTKARERTRTVPLTDSLCRELLVLAKGKEPDDCVFSLKYGQLDFVWQRVREAAGLEHVRFKDLRAQTAIHAERAGLPQTVVQRTMGHSDVAMTRRYQQHAASMERAHAERLERQMLGQTGS